MNKKENISPSFVVITLSSQYLLSLRFTFLNQLDNDEPRWSFFGRLIGFQLMLRRTNGFSRWRNILFSHLGIINYYLISKILLIQCRGVPFSFIHSQWRKTHVGAWTKTLPMMTSKYWWRHKHCNGYITYSLFWC